MSGMKSLKKGTKEEPGEIPGGNDPSLEKGPRFQEEAAQGWVLKDEGAGGEDVLCPGVLRPLVLWHLDSSAVGFGDADKAGYGHHRWLWKGSPVSQKYKLLLGSIHTFLLPPRPEFSTSYPLLSWFLELTEEPAFVGPLLARCVDRS